MNIEMLCNRPLPNLEEVDVGGVIGLLRRAECGDIPAAGDLMRLCEPVLHTFFRCWSGLGSAASGGRDDLSQDVCIALWQSIVAQKYTGVCSAADFWRVVARRAKELVLSQIRFDGRQKRGGDVRHFRNKSHWNDPAGGKADDMPAFEVEEEFNKLLVALDTPQQRSVAQLLFAFNSLADIGRSLELSKSTVKRRVKEIRARLQPGWVEVSGAPARGKPLRLAH